jgi:hypothetical protein
MPEANKFALNALVAPAGIVPGQLLNQPGHGRVSRWASGSVRVRPVAGYQAAMPAQDRGRSDESVGLQRPGQMSDQGGEDGAVRPIQPRLRVLPAQDRVLVTQDEDLHVLGRVGSAEEDQPRGDAAEHEVDQAQ